MHAQYGTDANIFPGKNFVFPNNIFFPQPFSSALSLVPTVPSITNVSDAEFVLYTHRSFGSHVLSTFLAAIRAGWLSSIPRLTPQLVLNNPPLALATSLGHLDACRQGLHSTRSSPSPAALVTTRAQRRQLGQTQTSLDPNVRPVPPAPPHSSNPVTARSLPHSTKRVSFGPLPPPASPPSLPLRPHRDTAYPVHLPIPPSISVVPVLHARLSHRSQWLAVDLTGKYPVRSRLGHEYILISTYLGYIHYTPQVSRTKYAYRDSFLSVCSFFSARRLPIKQVIMDNEKSDLLDDLFVSKNIEVEYVPPGDHRTNPAERAIRTGKNHLIASLASCHISFPPDLWHLLLPTIELTLNSQRPWKPEPSRSAYDGMHGSPPDFYAHPIHPVGQLCVVHDPPTHRSSWDQHGLLAHYLGPGMDHYRCDLVFVSKTQATRYSHTVAHYPDPLFHWARPAPPPPASAAHPLRPHPTADGSDLLGKSFLDDELGPCTVSSLADPILLQPGTGNLTPGLRLAPGHHHALTYFDRTGRTHTSSVPEVAHWVCNCPLPVPAIPEPLSPDFPGPIPSGLLAAFFSGPFCPSDLFASKSPHTGTSWDPTFFHALSAASAGVHTLPLPPFGVHPQIPALRQYFSLLDAFDVPPSPAPRPFAGAFSAHHSAFPPPSTTSGIAPTYTYPPLPGALPPLPAPATLGLDHLGRPLTWKACLSGPNRDIWLDLSGAELLKLVRTTGSLKPCLRPTKQATYYNQVPGEKWKNNAIVRRVRGTGGGDRIQVDYSVATPTANLPTVKCILHATVSEDAFFGVIDITDFYLGSPMPSSEFLKLYTSDYRPALLDDLGITPFIQCDNTGKFFFYATPKLSPSRVSC